MKVNDTDIGLLIGALFASAAVIIFIALIATPEYPKDALDVVENNPNCYVTVGQGVVELDEVLESCDLEVGNLTGDL